MVFIVTLFSFLLVKIPLLNNGAEHVRYLARETLGMSLLRL